MNDYAIYFLGKYEGVYSADNRQLAIDAFIADNPHLENVGDLCKAIRLDSIEGSLED